jgi:hypothetical protein
MAAPGNRGLLRWRLFLSTWPLWIFLASCASLKIPVDAPTVSRPTFRASREGVTIGAHAIEGRESYWVLFDDELPLIGIAALWVRIENSRAGPIDLSDLTWTLQTGSETFSGLSVEQVLERYYERRGVRFYSLNSDRKTREDLERVTLKGGLLPPSGVCQGFVFLEVDHLSGHGWSGGARLFARGIRLEGRQKIQFEFSPVDAQP